MITVIGLGFVGLTTALGFSDKGFRVYGYDIDQKKTSQLRKGIVPFYEPQLENKLREHLNSQFTIVDHLKQAVEKSEIVFVCVGTPSQSDGSVDLSFIFTAITSILEVVNEENFKIVVIKSTIPPGTTEKKLLPFIEKTGLKVGKDIGLATNPEFLREGYSWEDFLAPDRIIIGEKDDRSGRMVEAIYKPFQASIFRVSLSTAEFIKYASNTLLATLISFSNEQSIIATAVGNIDIKEAFHLLHLDKRWHGNPAAMSSYLYPGCGFGGYCLPKDTKALMKEAETYGVSPAMLKSTIDMNEQIKQFVVNDLVSRVKKNEKIGILGLSFKPNSDDVRDTPAKSIIEILVEKDYEDIIVYDPMAMDSFKAMHQLPVDYAPDLQSLLSEVKHVVIVTAWDEFKKNEALIKEKNVYDYRYFLSNGVKK